MFPITLGFQSKIAVIIRTMDEERTAKTIVDGGRDDDERRLGGDRDAGNWLVSASRSITHVIQ